MLYQANLSSSSVHDRSQSALPVFRRDPSKGVQVYEVTPAGQQEVDAVGRSMCHMAADKQTTGEAVYVDDMPSLQSKAVIAIAQMSCYFFKRVCTHF